MELKIGSNIIRNSTGVLNVQGKEQISIGFGRESTQLLLTMDIYDSGGKHIAKLNRNAWVFNEKERYEITTHPQSLKLIDTKSGDTVVQASILAPGKIEVSQGTFYTHKGHLLEITPEYWKIGGLKMSGNVIDGAGTALRIG